MRDSFLRTMSRIEQSQQAVKFIESHCANVGAFRGTTAVNQFLAQTAEEMNRAVPSDVFPDGYINNVACALEMVARNFFTMPPAAIASFYLATRFEFYFRILSGKLNADGTWVSLDAQEQARAKVEDSRIERDRISDVALTYEIMKLEQSSSFVEHCTYLDDALYSMSTPPDPKHLGDRIKFARHPASHGQWDDISSEGLFYGLMTALLFYSSSDRSD